MHNQLHKKALCLPTRYLPIPYSFDYWFVFPEEVTLRVWDTSELAVSIYPRFQYSAIGAGGPGVIVKQEGSIKTVRFNVEELQIPDLDFRSARVLGIPIPPPLRIKITTKTLEVMCFVFNVYIDEGAF